MILLTGVMAAGKSTVAQALAERFPRAAHVRGDTFRRFVVRGRAEPSPEMPKEARDQLLLRYQLAAATGDAYAYAGFVAVVQDVIVGDFLTDVVQMFRTPELFVVVLDVDAAVIEAREAARRKNGYNDPWTPEQLVADFRSSTPRIGLWLNATDLDPHQVVDAILDQLNAARIGRPSSQSR